MIFKEKLLRNAPEGLGLDGRGRGCARVGQSLHYSEAARVRDRSRTAETLCDSVHESLAPKGRRRLGHRALPLTAIGGGDNGKGEERRE